MTTLSNGPETLSHPVQTAHPPLSPVISKSQNAVEGFRSPIQGVAPPRPAHVILRSLRRRIST